MEPRRTVEGTRSLGSQQPAPPPQQRSKALSLPRKSNFLQEHAVRTLPDLPRSPGPVTSSMIPSQTSSPTRIDPVYAEVKPRNAAHNQEAGLVSSPAVVQAGMISRESDSNSSDDDSGKDGMHDSLLDLADDLGDDFGDDMPPGLHKPNESRPPSLDAQFHLNGERPRQPQVKHPLPTAEPQILGSQAPQCFLSTNEPDLTRDIPVFPSSSPSQGRSWSRRHDHSQPSQREEHTLALRVQQLTRPQYELSHDHFMRQSPLIQHSQKPSSSRDQQVHSSPQLHHDSYRESHEQDQKKQAKLLIRSWVKQQKIK